MTPAPMPMPMAILAPVERLLPFALLTCEYSTVLVFPGAVRCKRLVASLTPCSHHRSRPDQESPTRHLCHHATQPGYPRTRSERRDPKPPAVPVQAAQSPHRLPRCSRCSSSLEPLARGLPGAIARSSLPGTVDRTSSARAWRGHRDQMRNRGVACRIRVALMAEHTPETEPGAVRVMPGPSVGLSFL